MIDAILYSLSLASLILLFFIFYNNKSVMTFVPVVLLVLYYVPSFFDIFYGNYVYNKYVLRSANLFSLFVNFNLIFSSVLVFHFMRNRNNCIISSNRRFESSIFFMRSFLFLQIISLFFLLIAVYKVTSGNILSYSWASKHQDSTGGIWFLISSYLFVLSSGVVFLSWYVKNKKIFLTSVVLVFLYILIIRSRGFLIPVVLVFGFYYLVWRKKVIGSLILGFAFLFIFFILQQVRYLGDLNSLSELNLSVMVDNIISKIAEENSEFSLRNSFYFFVQNYDDLANIFHFGEMQTYRRLIFFFDGFSLGLKPKDFTNTMHQAYYGGSSLLSNPTLHPTLYGTIYANGTFFSSLVFSVFFSFLLLLENFFKKKGGLVYWLVIPIFLYSSIFMARGSIYNAFLVLILNTILLSLILYINRIKLI